MTGGALNMTGGALNMTGAALNMTGAALNMTGCFGCAQHDKGAMRAHARASLGRVGARRGNFWQVVKDR